MADTIGNLRVDGERLWASLMQMAAIGATAKGGNNRQALTDEDREGRLLFQRWCEEAGCTVSVDELGTMMALRPGRRPDLPPVALGSHLDTQPTGGKFDGVAGVLAGLEVVRTLNDLDYQTDHPILVVNWTNEEGTRFAPAMLASSVWAGAMRKEDALARTDRQGKTFGEELERIGFKGDVACVPQDWKCHLELHIEQGPILEAEGKSVGVVTGGQGIRWLDLHLVGRESHAGSTPMPRRKDALVAAAKIVTFLDGLAREHAPHAVTTVGELRIEGASRNTIPGDVLLTIDIRHPEGEIIDAMQARLEAAIEEACEPAGIKASLQTIWYSPPVVFDERCVAAVRDAAQASGHRWRNMVSGPGHDSFYTSRVVPTSMIFIPCKDGLSHNEEEWAEPEHVTAGADVLLRAAIEMAKAER